MAIVLDVQYVGGADAADGTDSGSLLVDELSQKTPFWFRSSAELVTVVP